MHKIKADVLDLFSSIQGEGLFLGAKQIFVRFKRCNMACDFCDEAIYGQAREYTSAELFKKTLDMERREGPHHSVSLTGGEPLLYTEFLGIFLELLKHEKLKTYLETNGTLPSELEEIIGLIDIVAMDFKLPSSTGGAEFWEEHLEFLKIASKKVFVKAVVTADTTDKDIEMAAQLIKKAGSDIPFILQPATPVKTHHKRVETGRLMEFMDIWSGHHLENIRVIPQMHKVLEIK